MAGRYLLPDGTKNPDGNLRYGGVCQLTVTRSRIMALTCPSDSAQVNASYANLTEHNYAVNFGNAGFFQELSVSSNGMTYATPYYTPATWLGAPFSDMDPSNYPSRQRVYNLSTITDGTSNTLMASEVIQGQHGDIRGFTWWGDSSCFETWLAPNSPLPDVVQSASYCGPGPGGTPKLFPQIDAPNPPCTTTTGTQGPTYAARSRHPGGLNSLMCDGSVKWIKNTIALNIWRALSTSQGGEIVSSDAY
jgi:prepilin-type processing-associated H-X9-DG protein